MTAQDLPLRQELDDKSGRTVLVDGSMVGGYRVSYLASGGQGVVYKGEKLGRTVVLKEVVCTATKEVPALLTERSLLERLTHPGIVSYQSFLCEQGHYYLVLEYVEGAPLSSVFGGDPPPIDDVVDWALQLCDVFAYLHSQTPPVIYRDLKPENIMLSGHKIKLIDFGIARLHKGDRAKDTELMGSRSTASPEQYGGAETDARSDIYCLGATIYDMLTAGQRKKVGPFSFAPVRQLRPEVPEALEKVLDKALQLKPTERYSNAREFRDAICQATGRPTLVESKASTPDKPKTSRGGRLLSAILLILLLAGGASALAWKSLQQQHVSEYPPSTGVQEASVVGALFGAGETSRGPVVFMGEDIGLFSVTEWRNEKGLERAKTLAERLNRFYKTPCLSCGGSNLESPDIRVGRYQETGELVVFYAHIHGQEPPAHGPLLLATVDEAQAKALAAAPDAVAFYWRDLIRDILALSRGLPVENSALGQELTASLIKARASLEPQGASMENLRKILGETTGDKALAYRELFLQIPQRTETLDAFVNVKGYEPLTN